MVTTGADIVLTGPPGEVVVYKPDGANGTSKSVTLGADGKATITAPSAPGSVTIILMSDMTKHLSVRVVDL